MNKKRTGISSYVLKLYVFLMVCIYPFYCENGFLKIGAAKNHFFVAVSVGCMFLVFISLFTYIPGIRKRRREHLDGRKISLTEIFLYLYMLMLVVSFFLSDYKQDVLWGEKGWYLGTVPLLLLSGFAVFLANMWKKSRWILYGGLIASGIVFLLGICNRFSFYPIPMQLENPVYISTLGNINWFCGYMSVIAPIGIGLLVFPEKEDDKGFWKKALLILYTWITFTTCFCQGSESVFLWNGFLFLVLLILSLKSVNSFRRWLLLLAIWGVSGQTVRALRLLLPGRYNYNTELLIDAELTLFIAVLAMVLNIVLKIGFPEYTKIPKSLRKGLCIVFIGMPFVVATAWMVIAFYNTRVGVSLFKDIPLFVFNESWGNGRGAIYKTAYNMFANMSPIQMLLGVGADGFRAYAYSVPQIKEYLTGYFGESLLTNAHSEIITNLINLGIFGTVAFYGMLISFVFRCIKRGKENICYCIPALSVICYMGNNLFSFAQILNLPFLFIIIGIGESYLTKNVTSECEVGGKEILILEHLQPERVFYYFEKICGIPHGSKNTKQISDFCVAFAKEQGLEYYQDADNNVIIIKEASAGYENAKPVILQGHLDMVCEKTADCPKDMAIEGIDVYVRGDEVRAKDTTLGADNGIAVAMAMAILEDKKLKHPRVEAVFTVDEEIGLLGAGSIDVSPLKGKRMINIDSEDEGVFTVSCAGGNTADCRLPISVTEYEGITYIIQIAGCKGGHSGVEIDMGRANPNVLMGRLLQEIQKKAELQIVSVEGGWKDNAIPVQSTAVVVCADKSVVCAEAERMQKVFANEFAIADPDVTVAVSEGAEDKVRLTDKVTTDKIISMLTRMPNGIRSMSKDIDWLVQTSLNMGIVETREDIFRMSFCVRSSVDSEREMLNREIGTIMEELGGTMKVEGDYPGWEYKKDSQLRELMIEVFKEQYGKEPKVEAIHAGLECGIFVGKIPGLDCVSIGPNLKRIHTVSESMNIPSVQRVYSYILEVLRRMK